MSELQTLHNSTACDSSLILPYATKVVNGEGAEDADLMLVGEAPELVDQEKGRPFVGDAGKILDDMLEKAGIVRKSSYITNVVKSRSSYRGQKNRTPNQEEVKAHKHILWEEIKLVKPKVIISLGRVSSRLLLLDNNLNMTDIVGRVFKCVHLGCVVVPAWHPKYIMQYRPNFFDSNLEIFRLAKRLL